MRKIVPLDNHSKLHSPSGSIHCHKKDGTVCKSDYLYECNLLCSSMPEHFPPRNMRSEICKHFLTARTFKLLNPCDSIEFTNYGRECLEKTVDLNKLETLVLMAKNLATRKNNFSNLAAIYHKLYETKAVNRLSHNGFLEIPLTTFLVAAELMTKILPEPIWLR